MAAKIDLANFDGQILLTGSTGHIGRNLMRVLAKYNFPMKKLIVGLSKLNSHCFPFATGANFAVADLTNEDQVKNIFKHHSPTHIVHLAALASPNSNNIGLMYDLNIKATHYLLEHCNDVDFIFASSVLVYGQNNNGGFVESDKLKPDSVYGITKVACESLIDLYYKKGKIRPRVLRLCGNVGPHMTHGKIVQAMNSNNMKLYGKSPGSYVPLCYVDDTCEAIIRALISNRPALTANIAPDDYLGLDEIVKTVNPQINIEWVEDGSFINMLQIHNEQANYLLDWAPKYTSREALEKFVAENASIS